MLDNVIYSLNAVLPLFLIIAFGFILKRKNTISDSFVSIGEKFVYSISLPVLVFLEIATSDISEMISTRLFIFTFVSFTLSFLIMSLVALIFVRDKKMRGSFVQGACRPNFAILGIPLTKAMFGGAGMAVMAFLLPVVTMIINTYSVILFFVFHTDKKNRSPGKVALMLLVNLVKNPLIIAVIAALPFMILRIKLPTFLSTSLGYISDITTPLALICIGAGFHLQSLRERAKYAISASFVKIAVLPVVMVIAAYFLGLRSVELCMVFLMFGTPSAVSSYIMAKNMNGDGDLAAQILLITTAFCMVTIFIGAFTLKTLGFI